MTIKNEILSFDANSGSVLVRYFTDTNLEGYVYNVDVPMVDGEYVSETELKAHVEHLAPTIQLERVDVVKKAQVPAYLSNIITENEQKVDVQTEDANKVIKQFIVSVLQEEGLIA